MQPTILYVEDNLENQILVQRVLESEGYRVVIAEDGLAGVRMAQELEPDLILMDINLPGMDGYAATTRIKSLEKLHNIPIVALTANVLQGDRERSLAAGCDGYLPKPFEIDMLLDSVDAFLKGKREEIQPDEKLEYVEEYASRLVSDLQAQVEALQRANEELRKLDRLKSEFVSTVSHELRTPLNIVIGHGEVLEDELFGPLNPHQKRYVNNIVRSARHLYDLVQDILDLSRIESGRLFLQREAFPLDEAMDELRIMLDPIAQRKGLQLIFQVEAGLTTMFADRLRFKQIINNLVSNAVKFTPTGGTITCLISRPYARVVQIEVIDSGIGIPPEYHGLIFERFRQVDSSASREGEGAGLGLTLTREFAEMHGGTITLQSEPGRGTVFTVLLPQE